MKIAASPGATRNDITELASLREPHAFCGFQYLRVSALSAVPGPALVARDPLFARPEAE